MLQQNFLSRLIIMFVIIFMTIGNSFGQSVFRVGTWCFFNQAIQPQTIWPIYFNQSAQQWRVKGPERDRLLNAGLNFMIACSNLQGEDALVFMGDSLDAAPVRKDFKSTLSIAPPTQQYPQAYLPWLLSRTAQRYGIQSWNDSVTVGYQAMYNRHLSRIDGVHSFLTAAEGCINQGRKLNGINFMCNNTIIDSYVQLGYVPTAPSYCSPTENNTLTTYYMARRLVSADHLMTGNYVFRTSTPTSGSAFQTALDNMIASFSDAARGIKDSSSIAKFWTVLQTQESPDIPAGDPFRSPTQNELLGSVNLSLAYGAKGIVYYLWDPVTAALDPSAEEYGLLADSNHNPRTPTYYDVQSINTNYQGTGQSLVTIGANFLNLTWKEGVTIHQNTNEPINSTYKLYDVTAKPPGGADDAENQTYVEVGVLQNAGNVNHYMVVNRRCTTSETREVTVTFQSTTGNAYRITDIYTGGMAACCSANVAGGACF
jgi:hypothetical protein